MVTTEQKNPLIGPVLKWVGGKRQLLQEIRSRRPNKFSTYYEPFLGGGAVFFDLVPQAAVLNDMNVELVNVYEVVRDSVDALIKLLKEYKNEEAFFYNMRQKDRTDEFDNFSPLERAARVIYLNKTCYNGLFRVNSQGEFNSPFGFYKTPNIVNEPVLRAVSEMLSAGKYTFFKGDYKECLKGVRRGDFVYLDPPYDPVSSSASFTGYTQEGFNREKQECLFSTCCKLHEKGAKFMLSNSSTPFIHSLYKHEGFHIELVQAKRNINAIGDKRGNVDEVLVRNYK